MARGRAHRDPAELGGLFRRLDRFAEGELLDTRKVATIFGVKPRTVGEWARSKKLPGLLINRRAGWRFTPEALKEFAVRYYAVRPDMAGRDAAGAELAGSEAVSAAEPA